MHPSGVLGGDVVVYASNDGGRLLPGMTANATIDVASVRNALTVPIAALHGQGAATTAWGTVSGASAGAVAAGSTAQLLVDRDGKPAPVTVYVRLTSGTQAAVQPVRGALSAGDSVVVGVAGSRRYSGAGAHVPAAGGPMSAMRGLH